MSTTPPFPPSSPTPPFPPSSPTPPSSPNPNANAPNSMTPSPLQTGPVGTTPGIIPFRPLTIGDLIEGTFKLLRTNPVAMIALPIASMAALGFVSAVFTFVVIGSTSSYAPFDNDPFRQSGLPDFASLGFASPFVSIIEALILLVVWGIIVIISSDAIIGRTTTLDGAFKRLMPRLMPLIGTGLLVGVIAAAVVAPIGIAMMIDFFYMFAGLFHAGDSQTFVIASVLFVILLGLLAIVGAFLLVKFLYAPIVAVAEGLGPVESIKRGVALTKGRFFPTLGRALLIMVLASAAIVGIEWVITTLVNAFDPSYPARTAIAVLLSTVAAGITMPITLAYEFLMYTDERMRREDFGQVLAHAAGY